MIRVMRRWRNGDVTSVGLYVDFFWAWRSTVWLSGRRDRCLWIEDERKPATKVGHS